MAKNEELDVGFGIMLYPTYRSPRLSCLDALYLEETSASARRCLAKPSGNKGVREPLPVSPSPRPPLPAPNR